MQIKELRLNIEFKYIKEIRKYIYSLETLLRDNDLCDVVNQVPTIPDDVEPYIERLNVMKDMEDKRINIFISQAHISILFVYYTSINLQDDLYKEIQEIYNIADKIKIVLKQQYASFKVNFDSLVLASSKLISKDNQEIITKYNIDASMIENRNKIVNEVENKYIKTIEKSFIKFYDSLKEKKKIDSFLGWNYILVIEISNRLEYENIEDDTVYLSLDIEVAYSKLKEYFLKEIK